MADIGIEVTLRLGDGAKGLCLVVPEDQTAEEFADWVRGSASDDEWFELKNGNGWVRRRDIVIIALALVGDASVTVE